MGASIKTVKLKIDPIANKGKITYLQLTRQMVNMELEFYNDVIIKENIDLSESLKSLVNHMEQLTKQTKKNPKPKHPLHKTMIPSPSITKRSIIAASIGHMKSYYTRLDKWQKSGSKKGKPGLPTSSTMPTFYYEDYTIELNDIQNQFVSLRVFTGEKWELINYPVKFSQQFIKKYEEHLRAVVFDKEYKTEVALLIEQGLDKKIADKTAREKLGSNPHYKMCSPSLAIKNGIWYLTIPFEKTIYVKAVKNQLKEGSIKRTLAVDLGISHLAVITIMEGDKLLETEFIRGSKINTFRYKALKQITRNQALSGKPVKGERSNKKLWEYVSNLNEDTTHQVSARIVALAKTYDCQVIIFEHLRNFNRSWKNKAARLNLKLNYWVHGKIVDYTKYKAYGEKILTVERNPFMSSQIHYQSNAVGERFSPGKENGKSLILFEDGSILNADFNASMNMHRKFFKTFPQLIMKDVKQKKKLLKEKLRAS